MMNSTDKLLANNAKNSSSIPFINEKDVSNNHKHSGWIEIENIPASLNQPFNSDKTAKSLDANLLNVIDPNTELLTIEKSSINNAINIIEKYLTLPTLDRQQVFAEEFINAIIVIKSKTSLWDTYRAKIKAKKPTEVRISEIDKVTKIPVSESNTSKDNNSVASEIITYIIDNCEIFFDPNADKSFITVEIDGVLQTLQIGSKAFVQWLSYNYFEITRNDNACGKSLSDTTINQACTTLVGIAIYKGQRQSVNLRIADYNSSHIIFLSDDKHRVIEVSPGSWQIVERAPVKFWKSSSMKSLPLPQVGGELDRLWKFINIPKAYRPLVLAWMLESFRAKTPKPILSLTGPQGSVKSSTQNKIRQLIDNNAANLRAAPKSIDDVYVSAGVNWVMSFENISGLSAELQDAFCTLSTGTGFAKRKLYTNDEETIIEVKRPIIINSIPNVITAQDLVDRAICIELPCVQYKEETEIEKEWEAAKPSIFGGLLDLFASTLKQLPNVKITNPPRMADFARLGEAMMIAQGHQEGSFISIYSENRQLGIDNAIESSSVAQAICTLVDKYSGSSPLVYYDTVQELLIQLTPYRNKNDDWPKCSKALGIALKRQITALKTVGIDVVPTEKVERINNNRGFTCKIFKSHNYATINVKPTKTVEFDHDDKERF